MSRQNTLFVSEDWKAVYTSLTEIDFTALDFQDLRVALMNNLSVNYPEEFNDWIGSSEFVIKMDTLVYLVSSLAFRYELNARENYINTAERRSSILNLAYNIAYDVSRTQAATGLVNVTAIRTTQVVYDIDDNPIRGDVIWNDASDPNWFDKFISIMNAAFDTRSKWGRPVRRFKSPTTSEQIDLYRLNSPSPSNGVYSFTASVPATSLPFNVVNATLDEVNGGLDELQPDRFNNFHITYQSDGAGFGSIGTGFALPIKQGNITSTQYNFTEVISNRIVDVDYASINNKDVWVAEIDDSGDIIETWTKVDTAFNQSIGYNPNSSDVKIFEVITKDDDKISLRFGDGKFGQIPIGRFVVFFRQSSEIPYTIRSQDVKNRTITLPYVSNGEVYQLSITFDLATNITNAAAAETAEDIKSNAPEVFYTQNRMASATDYNLYPKSDNAILKVKTVNRTYAGHSSSIPLNDPSGAYDNKIILAKDGRLYKNTINDDSITNIIDVSWSSSLDSIDTFINDVIVSEISKEDKQIFYYSNYTPIPTRQYLFTKTSSVNGRALGKLDVSTNTSPLDRIGTNTLLLFRDGSSARVSNIAQDSEGLVNDSISLKRDLPFTSEYLTSFLPSLRRKFTDIEQAAITDKLLLKRSFALRWNQDNQIWSVIDSENIDRTGAFSLDNAGDNSGAFSDASWMVLFEYQNQIGDVYNWKMTPRGQRIEFESGREVQFYFADNGKTIDPVTGDIKQDGIFLTVDNQKRNSLGRLSQKNSIGIDPKAGKELLRGDGTTTNFSTSLVTTGTKNVFLTDRNGLALSRSDWAVSTSPSGLEVIFDTPLTDGEFIVVTVDPRKVHMPIQRDYQTTDGTSDTFSLRSVQVASENTFVFVNGLHKLPFHDYSVYETNVESIIKLNQLPQDQQPMVTYKMTEGEPVFVTLKYVGDASTRRFPLRMAADNVLCFVNGVRETDFTIDETLTNSNEIVFSNAPSLSDEIHIRALYRNDIFLMEEQVITATAGQTKVQVTFNNASADRLMVFVNNQYQSLITYDDTLNDAFLSAPLAGGEEIRLVHFTITGSRSTTAEISSRGDIISEPEYIDEEVVLNVNDSLYHADGYINQRGISITDIDEDLNGEADNPFFFNSFVIDDDKTDLVLWQKIQENGFDVWYPISNNTIPRGTYHSPAYVYSVGEPIGDVASGSIHYDVREGTWLIADRETSTWIAAEKQSDFRWRVGRDNISFRWEHYANDDQRINIVRSSIMDMFVLTQQYDNDVRSWIDEGGTGTEPSPESGSALRQQFSHLLDKKMATDSIIFSPARYLYLFGDEARSELQAKFVVIKTPTSNIPDSDLKISIVNAIDTFFDQSIWDFGESFYFTQLSTFIHQSLLSEIDSVVIVSKTGENFGHLFSARAQPDEIFLSTAGIEEIEIVQNFTNGKINR